MIFPISSLFFFSSLIIGVLLAVSSTSWFGAWIGLELNLISFIPLIINKINPYSSEAALKYFLIQALSSTLIILSSCLILHLYNFTLMVILIALLLKLGAAPFHYWFPQVIEGLSWLQAIILITIQKLAPIFLISYLVLTPLTSQIVVLSSILSAYIGALGGLNIISLRKILAFSSINHISWILVALSINDIIWITYFSFYSIISFSVIFFLHSLQSISISDLLSSNNPTPLSSLSIPLSLLSLGGLPPFTGFIPKWIIIQIILTNHIFIPTFFLLSSALITLYFYLRILIPYILLRTPIFSFNLKSIPLFSLSFTLPLILFLNVIGLFIPLLFNLF